MGYFCDPDTGGPVRLDLRSVNGQEFQLLRPIAYRHSEGRRGFIVPAQCETFRTDLASVPGVLTWLVPRTGVFLPAAVLHDALVWPRRNYLGPPVTRREADLVFRDALVELGTGRVRAWLMWSAVSAATLWIGDGPTDPRRARTRAVLLVCATVLLALAVLLVLGLAGVAHVLPGVGPLGGIGAGETWRSLGVAALWIVLVPVVLAPLWGREAPAAAIAGWGLFLTAPATVPAAILAGCYLLLERLVSGPRVHGRRRRPGDVKARREAVRSEG